ncbi:MAG: hypothetical protein OEZ34_07930 [Spirochaetia bacterium]|nr:hypothetical protein [Spirochaetia bacterium]
MASHLLLKEKFRNNFVIVNLIAIAIHITMLILVDGRLKSDFETMLGVRLGTSLFHLVLILFYFIKPVLIDVLSYLFVCFLSLSLTSMELSDYSSHSMYYMGIVQTLLIALLFDVKMKYIPFVTISADLIYILPVFYFYPEDPYTVSASVGLILFSLLYVFVSMKIKKFQFSILYDNREKSSLIDSIDELFFCIKNDEIVYKNQVTEKFFSDYGIRETDNKKINEIFPDMVDSDFFTMLKKVESEGGTVNYYLFFPFMNKHFNIHMKKSPEFVSVVMRDVTDIEEDRKNLYQKTIVARKSFHDIGSVLQSTVMRFMLKPEMDPVLVKEFEGDVRVVRDIMYEYKKQGGNTSVMEDVNLEEILYSCINRIKADQVGVKYTKLPSHKVKGSYTVIYRILENLTTNALKYRNGNLISFDFKENEKNLSVYMSNPTRVTTVDKNLFEFESRLDGTRDSEGEGIGLHTCKELAKSINAKIDYVFENQNITFVLDFVKA